MLTIKTTNNVAQNPNSKKKPKDFKLALTGGKILFYIRWLFSQRM